MNYEQVYNTLATACIRNGMKIHFAAKDSNAIATLTDFDGQIRIVFRDTMTHEAMAKSLMMLLRDHSMNPDRHVFHVTENYKCDNFFSKLNNAMMELVALFAAEAVVDLSA